MQNLSKPSLRSVLFSKDPDTLKRNYEAPRVAPGVSQRFLKLGLCLCLALLSFTVGMGIAESNYALLAVLALLLVAFAVFRKPHYFVILFLLSPLLPPFLRESFEFPLMNDVAITLFIALLAVLLSVVRVHANTFHLRLPPRFVLTCCIYSAFLFTAAYRTYLNRPELPLLQAMATHFFGPTIKIIGIYIFSYNLFSQGHEKAYSLSATLLFSAIMGSFVVDRFVYGFQEKLMSGYLGTGNTVGNLLVVSLPLLFLVRNVLSGILLSRILPYLAILTIMASFSRGSILALVLMGFALLVHKLRFGLVYLVLALILIIIVCYDSSSALRDTFSYYQLFFDKDPNIGAFSRGRNVIWANVFNYLADKTHFWFGGGASDFVLHPLNPFKINTQNHFLRIWVDSGLAGLIVVVFLYMRILFYSYFKDIPDNHELMVMSNAVFLSLIGALGIGMFSHFEVGSMVMTPFWIQVGWLVALRQRNNLRLAA